jgi:hypothetical protein
MARRPAIVKRKTKAIRVTKSEMYLVNKKHLGDEPLMAGDIHVTTCLNWYNYMANNSDAREYLKDYFKNTGKPELAKKLSRISDSDLPMTAAWLCRMISRGYKPEGSTMQFIGSALTHMWSKAKAEVTESTSDKPVISIQDRMREKAYEIGGEVEGFIDDNIDSETPESFYEWLQKSAIPAAYVTRIIDKIAPRLTEVIEAHDKISKDLVEGYSHFKKKDFERVISFFDTMIEDADRYSSNTKKVRQTRKPRVVSVDKKIKNLKWQREDATYKIASVAPEKIISAQELWTFNTKYKTITVLRAIDRGGLQVKGTSITGYDESTSFTKRTGRKPEEYITKVLNGGKLVLRKVLEDLKDAPLAYRINENTILLRVL